MNHFFFRSFFSSVPVFVSLTVSIHLSSFLPIWFSFFGAYPPSPPCGLHSFFAYISYFELYTIYIHVKPQQQPVPNLPSLS